MPDSLKSADRSAHVTETPDVSHIKNVDVAHEVSDVNVGGILRFVVGLTILTGVIYVLMVLLFNFFNSRELTSEAQAPPGPMAMTEKERLPPEPRLQAAPGFAEDLSNKIGESKPDQPRDRLWEVRVLRNRWDDVLSHGMKDQNGRVVSIPIDEAIRKVVEAKDLPVRSQTEGKAKLDDYAVAMPTAASSGRTTEKRTE